MVEVKYLLKNFSQIMHSIILQELCHLFLPEAAQLSREEKDGGGAEEGSEGEAEGAVNGVKGEGDCE